MALSIPSARNPPPGHLSGSLQLCPPQGGEFAVTGQPGGGVLSKAILVFSILKDVHALLFILNFLSFPNIKILNRVDKPCLRTTPNPTWEISSGIRCSVPDRIDFAIVERMRKFNCSSPFTCRYLLIAVEQSDFSLLVKL